MLQDRNYNSDSINNNENFLRDVISWLIINSMRVDGVQFSLLCEQNVNNIWRKRGFHNLIAYKNELEKDNLSNKVLQSLLLFRERVHYSIENSIPIVEKYSTRIGKLIASNR